MWSLHTGESDVFFRPGEPESCQACVAVHASLGLLLRPIVSKLLLSSRSTPTNKGLLLVEFLAGN